MKIIIIATILVAAIFWGMFNAIEKSIEVSELSECLTWQELNEVHPDFYLLKWQDKQCRERGIIIDTVIK